MLLIGWKYIYYANVTEYWFYLEMIVCKIANDDIWIASQNLQNLNPKWFKKCFPSRIIKIDFLIN